MENKKNFENVTFGLDIGIASVGWAVLGESRIIDLGVRCFDKAETAKEGESLNLARRTARLTRRRLRRRAWRLTKLARLLKREGLISDINELKGHPQKGTTWTNLWSLRVSALDNKLSGYDWARVIYHIVKHRGFHWISKAEENKAEEDNETGKVKKGLANTKRKMQEMNYRTAAEMVLNEFPEAQRNKDKDYSKSLARQALSDELALLFKRQRELGNQFATELLEEKILDRKAGLLWSQKPPLSGYDLLKMLGKCTLENSLGNSEYRAPKASFSVERHVWLTRLNNLRTVLDGEIRPLTPQEHAFALELPYQQASDFTYKQLRNALVKEGLLPKDGFRFNLSYPSAKELADEKTKNPEDEKMIRLNGWQTLRKTFEQFQLTAEWKIISTEALNGNAKTMDEIIWVLSVFKEDGEVESELNKLDLPNKQSLVAALINIRFDGFSNLSLKALNKIIPFMNHGHRYDLACEMAGYHHSQMFKLGTADAKYLPPFYTHREKDGRMKIREDIDVPRNPVVLRSLNQARKVVNALVKKYGSPMSVHIEMARDLSKPFDERRKIEKDQAEYRERNEKDKAAFNAEWNSTGELKGKDFEKWQLYREQDCKCVYSLQSIDIHRLFENGYVEIDHAIPYSRSFDDSKNNRVLVLTKENRNKGNQTPYEYLDGKNNSERWRNYVAFVNSNKKYRQAKRNRLLKRDFTGAEAEAFRDRNLNDTRYICRFFKNYVERFLKLATESESKRCVVTSGQLTSFLRARWGLIKVRADSDRHHALDAVVTAACSHAMVKRLSDYSRRKELDAIKEGFVDPETGEIVNLQKHEEMSDAFPNPWPHFRQELIARLNLDDQMQLHEQLRSFGTYDEDELNAVKPLFVSRAPQRRNGGAAHKETIYGQPEGLKAQGGVTEKVAVTDLTVKDFGEKIDDEWQDCKLIDPHRNEAFYNYLKKWVEQKDSKEKEAKEIEKTAREEKRKLTEEEIARIESLRQLPRKPSKSGQGSIVRKVTRVIDKLSGIPIRGGIAKNDSMLRVDVFKKDNKFHLVPVYVHHLVTGLPNRAIVQAKDEDEWTVIDDSFEFLFSLSPNDFIKISLKNDVLLNGYYCGCDRAVGTISIWAHDRSQSVGKDGLIRSIGVKTAVNVEKFNVDILGNLYPAPKEKRCDLA